MEEEEEAAQPQGKQTFTVKLTGFTAEKKVALIKEIKNIIPGSNLVQVMNYIYKHNYDTFYHVCKVQKFLGLVCKKAFTSL